MTVNRQRKGLEKVRSDLTKAVEILYPDRADPPLLPALPLHGYIGTYNHPAYQNITVELAVDDSRLKAPQRRPLKAVRDGTVWPSTWEFEHVSSEYWVVYTTPLNIPIQSYATFIKAEFRVGASGKADQLLVEFASSGDGSEGVITFDRIE